MNASNDLSFEIKKGEAVAFLGHNGAGKSTALKMITDLERIGDQTSDIAELLPYLQKGDISFSKVHIKEMAESTFFPRVAAQIPRISAITALTPAASTPIRILIDKPVRVR